MPREFESELGFWGLLECLSDCCALAGSCGNGSSARRIEQLMLKYQFKPVFPDCYGLYVSVPILIYKKYIYIQYYYIYFGNFRACWWTKVKLSLSLSLFDYWIDMSAHRAWLIWAWFWFKVFDFCFSIFDLSACQVRMPRRIIWHLTSI